ncbi:hypothetical protein IQ260_10840 [Leptolyngbya cf. ectocarpi LEGE 11479]|uniref:Uncharacterized protein n=1 Tax=Leptolyngbya cf. ectocarpi LEGE 11479 TaxID=1828722 RepID=A0A928ZT05_LEPEC|nr:hypothetical protein [Leptolyngbya ectocarpi]MBE9067152.1 hypothetical protein [Leptolyngbya cf. ectocarpi LEGE 11479]
MASGDLVETVQMARENDLPEHAKSGTLAFIGGVLTAEINRKNIRRALDFLGHRFYGQKLALTYKSGDRQYSIEYRNQEDIDRALETIGQLDSLHVRIYQK